MVRKLRMKRSDDNLGKVESVSTIIVNFGQLVLWLGQILWWVFSFFTAFVLTSQHQQISLPGIVELNSWYKLVFLLSLLLGYIQLLKTSWENQKRRGKDSEGNFGSYVYGSTIKGKRPLVLIGFIALLGIIGVLVFTELIGLGIAMMFAAIIGGFLFIFLDGPTAVKQHYDDDFRKRWLKRVKNKLYDDGCTYTLHFRNLPNADADEINWAIKLYFDLHEFEQDLIFSEKTITRKFRDYELCEIRFEHVPSQISDIAAIA